MNRIIKRALSILTCGCMLVLASGCGSVNDEKQAAQQNNTEAEQEFSVQNDTKKIYDKDTLYTNEDETSVVTMYLTVSSGNESDNTNHTWTEVNSYSAYDYDEMGVERYAVNGLLQVGDENGPVEGELGYGQSIPNATVTIRGQTSSRYSQKNYRISIKDGKGTWNDQKVINLNKHEQDMTRFSNKMCYDLMKNLEDMI